jgi:pimeloyl-ACP methyl ester carboxylesterase
VLSITPPPAAPTVTRPEPRPGVSETFPYPRRWTRGDLPLAFFDTGEPGAAGGSSPVIVLVHGLGGNYTHFEHMAPLLAQSHRVLGVDMPGCGLSAKPYIRYSIDLFVDALIHFLDERGVERALLVGHSLGGMVVSRAMLRHPQRALGLVLINASGFWRYSAPTRVAGRLLLTERVLVPAMERWAVNLLDNVFHQRNEYTRHFMSQTEGRTPQPTVGEFGRVTESLAHELVGIHFLDDLDRFVLPTLVLWGENDKLIPARNLQRWVPRLPRGRLIVYPDCGHMPIIERPAEVVDAIRGFVRETLAATGAGESVSVGGSSA